MRLENIELIYLSATNGKIQAKTIIIVPMAQESLVSFKAINESGHVASSGFLLLTTCKNRKYEERRIEEGLIARLKIAKWKKAKQEHFVLLISAPSCYGSLKLNAEPDYYFNLTSRADEKCLQHSETDKPVNSPGGV